MILSRDRILTTHVGSLPRNEKLSDPLMAQASMLSTTASKAGLASRPT